MDNRTPLLIGQSDFRQFRRAGGYYVDKSLFIQDVIENSMQVLLLPRPRRFGKTLNLSMLSYFFENDEQSRAALFNGLKIAEHLAFEQHQGKYPVIFLTFKDQKELSWKMLFRRLTNLIREEFGRHQYLLQANKLTSTEKRYIESILQEKAKPADYSDALRYLSAFLSRVHGQQVVILLDEYDTPIQAGYLNGYYDEVINFMRNLLSGGLKDNKYLFKGVLTGILRVAKESIFSGLNNPGVYTLLSQEFNTAFGFTQTEVEAILEYYGLADCSDDVARWYNGYLFGGEVIYNPWSVLNYVGSADREFRPYWVNTGSTDLLEQLVTRNGSELREELEQLLAGQTITRTIYDNIVMRDLERRDNLLWSFLLFSGYLNVVEQGQRMQCRLQIPNDEVKQIYDDMVRVWFEEKVRLPQLETMLTALEGGNVRLFERMLRMIVTEVMSYHDLSGQPEKVYQALVLGMLVWLAPKYTIRTNRESGYGRYDMMFIPQEAGLRGIVLEFKLVYDDEKPETILKEALQQIQDKAYTTELEAAGVTDILCLAVVFRGKELWLKQGE